MGLSILEAKENSKKIIFQNGGENMKKSKTNLFRGIASISGALLAVTTIGQVIAKEYSR